ncbi:MAG TPA: class I SAM-dependent methyltransferase, partial [Sphingomicrobium sp.]|nr:class I SAM-dependent methyltransferase [Sphingomicrobium sp.]
MKCRHCGNTNFIPFADLANAPPSNAMLTEAKLSEPEAYYPLVVAVCDACFLAQVEEHKSATEIFDSDYTYFSSFSKSWLEHAERFAAMAIERFGLGEQSQVVEVASNDGYLLQYFHARGIPVLGVEPTANTAEVAVGKGIPTIVDFFGQRLAEERLGGRADLIAGNNVFAHVPDINDFSAGLKAALKPGGVVSLEFPHLLRLIEQNQFDTIYHEHFSYLSLGTAERILGQAALKLFDVEQLPTHGGSLRVFAAHVGDDTKPRSPNVASVLDEEERAGLRGREVYEAFQQRIDHIRADFLRFLLDQRAAGARVAGYGAAAKGNTLLNYCGIKGNELIRFVADASPHKQG